MMDGLDPAQKLPVFCSIIVQVVVEMLLFVEEGCGKTWLYDRLEFPYSSLPSKELQIVWNEFFVGTYSVAESRSPERVDLVLTKHPLGRLSARKVRKIHPISPGSLSLFPLLLFARR
jgi:hypothetical protein